MPTTHPRVAVVVGNPKAGSRTLNVALGVARSLTADPSLTVTDLAELSSQLFWSTRPLVEQALAGIADAELIVVATPVYKGSYAGLLKSFLDLLPHRGLAGKVAVPVTVMAAPVHALAADTHLRPLLVELGASVPTASVVVTESQLEDPALLTDWSHREAPLALATVEALRTITALREVAS